MTMRVLYVEDSQDDRELVEALVDGRSELELLVRFPADWPGALDEPGIDLVLTDLHLGGLDGFGVLEECRRRRPELPVVFLTATGDESLAVEALRRGADDYLVKHVEVLRRLPRLLEQARRRRAADLEAERSRLEADAIFASSPQPTLVAELDTGRILRVNPAFENRLPGRRGDSWLELAVEGDRAAAERALADLQAGRCVAHRVLRCPIDGGASLELNWCATPTDGRFVASARDLGHERRLEAHLREAELTRHLGRLTAGVAQDLDSLLLDLATVAPAKGPGTPGTPPALEEALNRLAALTRRLARLGAAREDARAERVDLAQTCRELLPVLEHLVGPEVAIRLDLPDSGPWVLVDHIDLERCLLDLAANAAEAMAGRGELRLLLGSDVPAGETPQAVLRIEDDGPGFPAGATERLFEPFATTKPTGSGLGLPSVQAALRRAGGRLRLGSPAPGGGAAVEIGLPLAPEAPVPQAAPAQTPVFHSLLVIDDEPALARLMARVLAGLASRSCQAGSVAEAERLRAEQGPFDLVVGDVQLQDGSGAELIRRWQREQPGTCGLLVSGHPVRSAGLPLLLKPFTPGELRSVALSLRGKNGEPPLAVGDSG